MCNILWQLPSWLPLSMSGHIKVAEAAAILLTLKKTPVEYTIIINDLHLLTDCELLCKAYLCYS